jgi:divalent metal cation (Fe/Co/Zn/Cd) transporter
MDGVQTYRRISYGLVLVALWLVLLLLGIKVWIGWATQVLCLVAAALQTLVVSFSLVLGLVMGVPFQRAKRGNWGHGRLEAMLTLLMVGVMGFAGGTLLAIALSQVERLTQVSVANPIAMPILYLLATITSASVAIGYFSYYWVSQQSLPGWQLIAQQMIWEAWCMVLALAGVVGIGLGYAWLDPLLASLLIVLAVINLWRVIATLLPGLLRQVAIAPEALATAAHQIEGILHCYNICSRGVVGRWIYIEMTLMLHPDYSAVEKAILKRLEHHLHHVYGPGQLVLQVDRDRRSTR